MNSIELGRVEEITKLHNEIGCHLRMSLEKAFRIGELLTEQKANMKHGGFVAWMVTNLSFTVRTANNYMRLYGERDKLKKENVSYLSQGYKLLSSPADTTKFERPWELYLEVKGKLLSLNSVTLENGFGNTHMDEAVTYSQAFLEAMQSYLRQVDGAGDSGLSLREYSWAAKVCYEIEFGWAEYRLHAECAAGEILNEMQASFPVGYNFLKANNFSNEAVEHLVNTLKKREAELDTVP